MAKDTARIDELASLIRRYKDAYYNGEPLVSDAAFDALEDELRTLAPEHEVLASIGAPVPGKSKAEVILEKTTEWEKARHAIPMGSLNKAVNELEFRKWAERCQELGTKDGLKDIASTLLVTEKLDGLSLECIYEKGVFKDAITRGDGEVGERITSNARRMKGVPPKLKKPVSVSVRGEIILKLSDMKKAFPDASNPRNQAAGTSKRFDGQNCEYLSVFFYDLEGEEQKTEAEKFERLTELGLTVPTWTVTDLDGAMALHKKYAGKTRASLDYEIDGLVIRTNDVHAAHMLGEKANRPRGAIAYKFASQAKISKVVDILWDTGPSGRVSPIAVVEPVEIGGATVQRASLHNVSNVAALGIGIGDDVLVSRRNDVIPYVEEVVAKHGPNAKPPKKCGICKSVLVSEGEYIACKNLECTALVEGRLQNWVGAQNILEWGEKLIAQLVEAKLAREPADLYKLEVKHIAALERRGEIIAKKVLDNLRAKLPLTLPLFLGSLGIEGFAIQSAKMIVAAGFDTLDKVLAAKEEELAEIPGLGPSKAHVIVTGLAARKAEIKRLLAVGVVPVTPTAGGGKLSGKSFCFTGALSKPRAELEAMVEARGGTLLSGVTKDLQFLVMADPSSGSSKAQKAAKYGTECIDEARFFALMAEADGGGSDEAAPAAKAAPAKAAPAKKAKKGAKKPVEADDA